MTTTTSRESEIGRLLIRAEDQPGIVAKVSAVLSDFAVNIVSLDQYSSDPEGGSFFQRTEFHHPELSEQADQLHSALSAVLTDDLQAEWTLFAPIRRKRVAIFASKTDHCLMDLLWRHRRSEIEMEIVMVISNHPDLKDDVEAFGIPFVHVPVDRDNKAAAEQRHLQLLNELVDLVILARYMQILSPDFLAKVGVPVINIHHSFLPAFIGAGPYQKAKDRGVKIIGATAHYVTEDLDEGPIIEQDIVRVSHRDTARDLTRRGANVERQALARAVIWHCEDRVLRHGNTTVVF
jgi:formyltetrahydrofolate deformylase